MKILSLKFCITIALVGLGMISRAEARCSDSQALPTFAERDVELVDDTLLFSVGALAMDLDGAKSAYGVRDQGVEKICNGLSALRPAQCAGKPARDSCFTACKTAYRSWYEEGHQLNRMGDYMCSIGLGGGSCSVPVLNKQDDPRSDWFVTETSLKLKVTDSEARRVEVARQNAQLDAMELPYFVIPGKFRARPWDATPGDVGVIIRADDGHMVKFVVGDTGGSLDEASARLLVDLYQSPLVTSDDTSALGETVKRVHPPRYNNTRDFRVAIFRHSGAYKAALGSTKVLGKFPDELVSWINQTADDRLKRLGGANRVVECTGPAEK